MNVERDRLLCAKQVADMLGVSERTAAGLLRSGEIEGFKLSGRRWRTRHAAVQHYIERCLARRYDADRELVTLRIAV